jgi:hypothetical protein
MSSLFDSLVGAGEQSWRDIDGERCGRRCAIQPPFLPSQLDRDGPTSTHPSPCDDL